MNHLSIKRSTALWFVMLSAACGGSSRESRSSANEPAPSTTTAANPPPASETPALANSVPASSLDALPPPKEDVSTQSLHGLAMTDSRGTVDPATGTIPLPTKIDVPSQAGVDAATKAVPKTIPVGKLDKAMLEAPLRDPARFAHCRVPYGTHVEIAAVVYNGSTLGVDVQTKPADKALALCVERTVRQTTFVKELAVNKVKVSF